MLILIPIMAFIMFYIVLGNLNPESEWRKTILQAAVGCGVFIIITTEFLSVVEWVTQLGLTILWLLPLLACVGWCVIRSRQGLPIRIPHIKLPEAKFDRILLMAITFVIFLTAVVAWVTPPQTVDSLNYHQSRIAHWAQEQSIRFFATGIVKQNVYMPCAEVIGLHFYVLSGGDRLANFVEWLAMFGSLVGVSWIAKQLGSKTIGQIVATLFAATIPMGIVQASSTKNDYVLAFWMVCVASASLSLLKDGVRLDTVVYVGMAAGLAFLTKPTSIAFLLSFAVLNTIVLLKKVSIRRSLVYGVVVIIIIFAISGGHLIRNFKLYQHPFGPSEYIAETVNESYEIRAIVSNLLRHSGSHAGSPWPVVNDWIYHQIIKAHIKLGISLHDPRTTFAGVFNVGIPSTDEDASANPFHASLILLLFIPMLVIRWPGGSPLRVYTLIVATTFLVFCVIFKWQTWITRLQLSFFVLFSPAIGFALCRILTRHGARLVGLGLVVAAWPWLVSIRSRPIIPNEQGHVQSVLVASRETLLFANADLQEPYTSMTEMIKQEACTEVGLMLSGAGVEYPLWVLLGAPDQDLNIEWIVSGVPSERLRQPDFQPCAILCGSCPEEWNEVRGLPLEYEKHGFRLFIKLGD
jgi:hypothetical protein